MSEIAAFVGPSLSQYTREKYQTQLDFYPPAKAGDIISIVHKGYKQIVLIDGYYNTSPSPWHKEILYALKTGIVVIGCSSYGAIRSAELNAYGMIPSGLIAEAYSFGKRYKDSDVAILHLPQDKHYIPTSISVVDLEDIVASMVCGYNQEEILELRTKLDELVSLHFTFRDFAACKQSLKQFPDLIKTIEEYFKQKFIGLKERDAELTIDRLLRGELASIEPLVSFDIRDIATKAFLSVCAEANYSIQPDTGNNRLRDYCFDTRVIKSSLMLKYLFYMGEDLTRLVNLGELEARSMPDLNCLIEDKTFLSILDEKVECLARTTRKYKLLDFDVSHESIPSLVTILFEDHPKFMVGRQEIRIDWLNAAVQYLTKEFR